MNCRRLHDHLPDLFGEVEAETYHQAIRQAFHTDDWTTLLGASEERDRALQHVSECSDCLDDLLAYLEIRDVVDVQRFPCLHLAYYSTKDDVRCIEEDYGTFSVELCGKEANGVVIGFCPWCGLPLPTSYADESGAKGWGLRAWQRAELERLVNEGFG